MLNNYPDVLTVKQLAEALNIGLNAAYELVNRHEIGAKRIGRAIRIPKSSVISILTPPAIWLGKTITADYRMKGENHDRKSAN